MTRIVSIKRRSVLGLLAATVLANRSCAGNSEALAQKQYLQSRLQSGPTGLAMT